MKKTFSLIAVIFIIGCILRGIFLYQGIVNIPMSTDEAIVGLMSKQILTGEFPLFFLGQSYLGPVDSYLGVFLTFLFGPGVFAVRLYHTLLSVLFMLLIYLITRDVYGREAGILSLILVSIPSSYFMVMSSYAQCPYMSLLVFGAVIFYISNKITTGNRVWGYFLIFGFLSGLSIWMHFLSILYIVPAGIYILVKRPKAFFKYLWITAVFFVVGIFPLWIGGATTNVTETVDLRTAFVHLKSITEDTLPGVLGIRAVSFIDTDRPVFLPAILTIPAGVMYVLSFIVFVFICIKAAVERWRLTITYDHLLLGFFIFTCAGFCLGRRSGAHEYRYLLPLYIVIPIIVARIRNVSRRFAYLSVTLIVVLNLYSNVTVIKKWNSPGFALEYGNLPETEELISFLESHNINYTYSSYWLSYRLTLETNEEIISSQPYNERFLHSPLKYLSDVDGARNAAFIFTDRYGILPSFFEENLAVTGGGYKKKIIGDFTVFYDFRMPDIVSQAISRTDWNITSNFGTDSITMALDGDKLTRWGSAHHQEPGMYFKIDLGRVYPVNKIVVDTGRFVTDGPRGYKVEVSVDNINWKTVINIPRNIGHLTWINGHPKLLMDGGLELYFPAMQARYIKITQIGADSRFDWSIAEIFVFREV